VVINADFDKSAIFKLAQTGASARGPWPNPKSLGLSFCGQSIIFVLLSMESAFEPDDLMTILDGIDDAVVKLDGQANFIAMNQVAASVYQRLGLDPQQMKGKSVWEVFLPKMFLMTK
jgi:hypothetical protein